MLTVPAVRAAHDAGKGVAEGEVRFVQIFCSDNAIEAVVVDTNGWKAIVQSVSLMARTSVQNALSASVSI